MKDERTRGAGSPAAGPPDGPEETPRPRPAESRRAETRPAETRQAETRPARARPGAPESTARSSAERLRPPRHVRKEFGDPFSFWSESWLVWRIGRRHLRTVTGLARGRAVDLGCGAMPMIPAFADRIDSIVGLDRRHRHEPPLPAAVCGDAQRLPFRTGAFATAFCLQVLEHVPEPETLLREACRVLEPGGYLILTVPHIWNVHEAPDDYYRYTQYGLEHLFRKAGFEIVEVRAMAGYFVTAAARFSHFLAHFNRWGLQPLIRPLFLLVGAVGWGLDRIYCDRTETWNYLAVGRKPVGGA